MKNAVKIVENSCKPCGNCGKSLRICVFWKIVNFEEISAKKSFFWLKKKITKNFHRAKEREKIKNEQVLVSGSSERS